MKYKAKIYEVWLATTFFDAETIEEAQELAEIWSQENSNEFSYDSGDSVEMEAV